VRQHLQVILSREYALRDWQYRERRAVAAFSLAFSTALNFAFARIGTLCPRETIVGFGVG
jgi:hypothetical protein